MRIGLVTTSFPRFEQDIAGNFVLGFAEALTCLGHEIEVLAPEPIRGKSPPKWENISLFWIPYIRPRCLAQTFYRGGVPDNLQRSCLAWLGPIPFTLALAWSVHHLQHRWDMLISHWAIPCAMVAGLSKKGLPHIAVFHSADIHLLCSIPAKKLVAQQIVRNSQKLIFVSPHLRDEFLGLLPYHMRSFTHQRSVVFPMGIESTSKTFTQRNALRKSFGFDRFTLLSISRLVPVKGIDDVIRTFTKCNHLEIAIAGDGPERPHLEKLASSCKAPVRFLGNIRGQRKWELLSAADAFICSSRILPSGRTEGMPTALLEAMAQGLPCIATQVGGISSFVQDRHSVILIPPSNQRALKKAVSLIMNDRELRNRLIKEGKKLANNYTWANLKEQLNMILLS